MWPHLLNVQSNQSPWFQSQMEKLHHHGHSVPHNNNDLLLSIPTIETIKKDWNILVLSTDYCSLKFHQHTSQLQSGMCWPKNQSKHEWCICGSYCCSYHDLKTELVKPNGVHALFWKETKEKYDLNNKNGVRPHISYV